MTIYQHSLLEQLIICYLLFATDVCLQNELEGKYKSASAAIKELGKHFKYENKIPVLLQF